MARQRNSDQRRRHFVRKADQHQMSFGIPVRNGVGLGLTPSTALSPGVRGIRPALLLNFVNTTALDSRITFTRASTATFIGSNGVIQSAAINAPRFDYNPSTLASRGLLIEETRTNLLLNSLIDGTSLSTQSVTVAAVSHTISFYGTGSITLTGAATATVTGTGVYPNRQTLTFTPIVGILVCTVVGSVQYAQLEVGTFATSFIPTAGTSVLRSPDVAQMTSTNFSSWYNQTEGTFVVGADGPAIGTQIITQADDGTQTERITGRFTGATSTFVVVDNNAGQVALSSGTITANVPQKLAYAYKLNDFALVWAGLAAVTDTAGTLPTPNILRVGVNAAGTEYLNGHIRQIVYYKTRLADTTLRVLTV
jgi:hypothetical protein